MRERERDLTSYLQRLALRHRGRATQLDEAAGDLEARGDSERGAWERERAALQRQIARYYERRCGL